MANKSNYDKTLWTKIETSRMEFFLLTFHHLKMHPSTFLNKWKGITVNEFAELLGVDNCKIYRWCGSSKPNISQYYLLKIALIDLFFEHFEDIPESIWKRLMTKN